MLRCTMVYKCPLQLQKSNFPGFDFLGNVENLHEASYNAENWKSTFSWLHVCDAVPLRAPRAGSRRSLSIRAEASNELSTAQTAALVSGAIFNPIILFSEWTLFSTGKGLDPGPAGIYGALEGIGECCLANCAVFFYIYEARLQPQWYSQKKQMLT